MVEQSPNGAPTDDDRRRRRIIRFWNREAALGFDPRWFSASRPWVCAQATAKTLDVCVGAGFNLPHYPRGIQLSGVDWSPGAIAEATRRAGALGIDADLRVGDAARLPYADGTFDTVVCTFSLCCVPDEWAALSEMSRVLRPGGILLLADNVAAEKPLLLLVQRLADIVVVPAMGHHSTRHPRPLVEALGFEIRTSERVQAGMVERRSRSSRDESSTALRFLPAEAP
jgi:ubiquinone/menaquinone biosynthesis C-methylase UbiE